MALTVERLREMLSYDPETGILRWLKRGPGNRNPNGQAGTLTAYGYIRIVLDQKFYLAHRLAWFYVYGRWPSESLDHKDHDRTNNAIANLRECTHQVNLHNITPVKPPTMTSRYRGVYWNKRKGRWISEITVNGKKISLGRYAIESEASVAYQQAKKRYHAPVA